MLANLLNQNSCAIFSSSSCSSTLVSEPKIASTRGVSDVGNETVPAAGCAALPEGSMASCAALGVVASASVVLCRVSGSVLGERLIAFVAATAPSFGALRGGNCQLMRPSLNLGN